jgi:hypothetical protein
MSYDSSLENSSTYQSTDKYTGNLVNANPDYHTLQNYYNSPRCPYRNDVGECLVRPVYITPSFGGSGYRIPGFNATQSASIPLSDSNYFNINQAYPQFCKTPLIQPTFQ